MAALSTTRSVLSSGRLGPVSRRPAAVAAAAVQSHVALSGPLLPGRLSSGRPAPVLRGSVPPVLRPGAFASEFASVRFFRSTCGCWVLSGLPLSFSRYVSASLLAAGCTVVASGCGVQSRLSWVAFWGPRSVAASFYRSFPQVEPWVAARLGLRGGSSWGFRLRA